MSFVIRAAGPDDVSSLLRLIRELARFEKLEHEVVATEETLRESLFGRDAGAEALLGIDEDRPIGFALFFFNYSTFLGRRGLYLEDLFVEPAHRGKGYGKQLFQRVIRIANERNCHRLDWAVLDWNQRAIDFYKSLGAKPLSDWTLFRLNHTEIRLQSDMTNGTSRRQDHES